MSKNKPNAFYYFVQEFRSKQPKRYETTNEFFQAAGPYWKALTPEQRKPYEDKAKRSKGAQVPKYTSSGLPIVLVEREEQEKELRKQRIKEDIDQILYTKHLTERIADEMFYIIHVNYFCMYNKNNQNIRKNMYVPAELAVARFTLKNGVLSENVFHTFVHPGSIETGYAALAKDVSEKSHQIPPPFSFEAQNDNMYEVLTNLKAFMLEMHPIDKLPPVYAEDKNLPVVEDVLDTLCYNYGGPEETFSLKVYPLDYFFFALRNTVGNNVWPQSTISTLELEKDVYDFCVELACPFHERSDVPNHCSQSHVMRKAYIIFDGCCGDLGIELIPGKHIPRKSKVPSSSRPSSRASSIASSYVTAQSFARRSTLKDEDYYLSTNDDSMFSETSTVVDPNDFPALPSSCNESAITDEDTWEKPKQRYKKHHPQRDSACALTITQSSQDSLPSNNSQMSNDSQVNDTRSRRPLTLSAALSGMSMSNSSGISSMLGRGRGRGFSDKI